MKTIHDVKTINVDTITPDKKDYDRAQCLEFKGSTFKGSGQPWKSQASKMAKLITNPFKLIRRAKAVAHTYGTYDYFRPHGWQYTMVHYNNSRSGSDDDAWLPFAEALINMGFTHEQIEKIGKSEK